MQTREIDRSRVSSHTPARCTLRGAAERAKRWVTYRAKQVSMSQPGRCQGFGGATTQIVVFRAIELKPLSPI
jgi:hypothetical protein